MKVVFLGTGEAFDENDPNNSSLIISDETGLLLDCGMTTPFQLWKYDNDQNMLDAVYISHSHADHYFGLPALLVRMGEEKRKNPITVICQKREDIKKLMDVGYKGFIKKLKIKINFIEIRNRNNFRFRDLELFFAQTEHSATNYAVRVESKGKSVCYSGDGDYTKETEKLYKNCDLLIHEAYFYDKKAEGHGCITDLIKMAQRNNVKCLALTHINRVLRKKGFKIPKSKVKIIVPKPFEQFNT
jgi:ribonuclease Z